jgi:hypothetical protein
MGVDGEGAPRGCLTNDLQMVYIQVWLIFYTASKIVLYYQRVAVARDERGTTDVEIGDQ